MGKLRVICILFILVVIAGATMALSSASLVPTTFGFPTLVQKGTTTTFNQDVASGTDLESINIDFPLISGSQGLSSTGFTAMPSGIGSMDMFNSLGASSGISPLTSIFGGTNLSNGI